MNLLHPRVAKSFLASVGWKAGGQGTEAHPGAALSRERWGLGPPPRPPPAGASVIQVLLLPGGCGDGAVRVHDDLGAANDHHDEEEAEEDEAGQGQSFVHVDVDGLRRGVLHLSAAAWGSSSGSRLTGTIFHPCREPQQWGPEGRATLPGVRAGHSPPPSYMSPWRGSLLLPFPPPHEDEERKGHGPPFQAPTWSQPRN